METALSKLTLLPRSNPEIQVTWLEVEVSEEKTDAQTSNAAEIVVSESLAMKKDVLCDNEDENLLSNRNGPAYKSSTITNLEQFIQQLPPSLLNTAASRKSSAKQQGDMNESSPKSGDGCENSKKSNVSKEKKGTGSVCVAGDNKGNSKHGKNEDGSKKQNSKRKAHDKKNAENKMSTSKSASNAHERRLIANSTSYFDAEISCDSCVQTKSKKPGQPARANSSYRSPAQSIRVLTSARSRSCSHCLQDFDGSCDFDAILDKLLAEKEKRVQIEHCVEDLKNEVSMSQKEVQTLAQSKKTAISMAKLLKKKFEKANSTNKEALKRVKALKAEKAELVEKLKKETEKLEALENEISMLKMCQNLRLSSGSIKVKGKDVHQLSRDNDKLMKTNQDQLKELTEEKQKNKMMETKLTDTVKKVKELKTELEKKKAEIEEAHRINEEYKERDVTKDPKVTQTIREKEAALRKKISILTTLETKQRMTISELKSKLNKVQKESEEIKSKLESEIDSLKADYQTQKELLVKEQADKEKFKSLSLEYNKIIKFRNDRIAELSKAIEDQEQTIESVQQAHEKEEQLMKQVEKENATLRNRIDNELNPQIKEMYKVMDELKKAKELAEKAFLELKNDQSNHCDKFCSKSCSKVSLCGKKLHNLREFLKTEDDKLFLPDQIIGDHKDVFSRLSNNEELCKIINQRKKLQKDLESIKEEKNKFYCDLKELRKENSDMLKRIGDLTSELEKAKNQAAVLPQQETKLNLLQAQLRKNEREWTEKWEKARKEKEEAIETAKNVTDKLVNCVASYQYETANLKKVQCMLVNLLNQKDAMLAVFDQKLLGEMPYFAQIQKKKEVVKNVQYEQAFRAFSWKNSVNDNVKGQAYRVMYSNALF